MENIGALWWVLAIALLVGGASLVMWTFELRSRVPKRERGGIGVGRLTAGLLMITLPVVGLLSGVVILIGSVFGALAGLLTDSVSFTTAAVVALVFVVTGVVLVVLHGVRARVPLRECSSAGIARFVVGILLMVFPLVCLVYVVIMAIGSLGQPA